MSTETRDPSDAEGAALRHRRADRRGAGSGVRPEDGGRRRVDRPGHSLSRWRRATAASSRSTRPRHAVTLLADHGVEILMHIGLDTVQLKGRASPRACASAMRSASATPLIDFDADYVATHARSLLTPIVITSTRPCRCDERAHRHGHRRRGHDPRDHAVDGCAAGAGPAPSASSSVPGRSSSRMRPACMRGRPRSSPAARSSSTRTSGCGGAATR